MVYKKVLYMSYEDICILGWNLNAMMVLINIFVAMNIFSSSDPIEMEKNSHTLQKLSKEFEKYYPNRRFETIISFIIPFTAFYRILFRLFEMYMFFKKNKGTKIYDFLIYKYQKDINKAKK